MDIIEKIRWKEIWSSAIFIRIIVILYGIWQDANFAVKFTDVDYQVFMDATAHVYNGRSPFDRTTYRYTPLLSYMLLPNFFIHPQFGKFLFLACDLGVGYAIFKILHFYQVSHVKFWTCVWLFNPLAIVVSSRGNADSFVCFLVLMTVDALLRRRWIQGALWFGLSVHFKIFPIIFTPAILLYIGFVNTNDKQPWWRKAFYERFMFGLVSGGLFLLLGALFYVLYGWKFIYEGYLYHLIRKDHRHNFSVYFYTLYLNYNATTTSAGGLTNWTSFLPQLIVQASFCVYFYRDIAFCICLQILAFVCFNKVCTAQYFIWYISLLPVILPFSNIKLRWIGGLLILFWILSETHWLYWAYRLEFLGLNTYLQVWGAGILFFIVNIGLIYSLILYHTIVRSKKHS